jgi:hypothetical protein
VRDFLDFAAAVINLVAQLYLIFTATVFWLDRSERQK